MSDMLAEFAVTRDVELRNQLVVANLPLVKFVARKMSSNLPENVDLDDLVSWGAIGLIDAIEKFQPARGHQFSTYAVWRIRGEIQDGLQRMEWAPKQIVSQVRALRRAQEQLAGELGRDPSNAELAAHAGVDEATVRQAWWARQQMRMRTLDYSPGQDGQEGQAFELGEEGDQEIAGEVAEIRSRVAGALEQLTEHEVQILRLYHERALTLREVAAELGISVSSATQAHTRLVDRVRRHLTEVHGRVA